MNNDGLYDGWTDYIVTVRPSFVNRISVKISGKDRNNVKEYLAQTFGAALLEEWNEEEEKLSRYVRNR